MKLLPRLALSLSLTSLGTFAALRAYDAASQHQSAEQRLLVFASERLRRGELPGCGETEAEPFEPFEPWGPPGFDSWFEPPTGPPRPRPPGGPGHARDPLEGEAEGRPRPAQLSRVDADGRTADGQQLPAELVRRARDEGYAALPWRLGDDSVRLLVHTGLPEPCAWALAEGSTHAAWGGVLPRNWWWLVPVPVLIAAVLASVGPLLRRIGQLSAALQAHAPLQPLTQGGDEIAHLAQVFERQRLRIEQELRQRQETEQTLRDFLANTTHDVMLPLTVLQGHLSQLRRGDALGASDTKSHLRGAIDEAHYLGAMLHNLALSSKLEQPAQHVLREPVDLNALVERVAARHRTLAASRELTLNHAVAPRPLWTLGDVTAIEQAVSNLVHNAIRYHHAGGHVALLVEAEGERDAHFALRVLDDGPGIEPALRSALLERGARADSARTRAPEGQGLGLYIVRRAAELHGFALELSEAADDDGEPRGLSVSLRGPTCAAPARAPSTPDA